MAKRHHCQQAVLPTLVTEGPREDCPTLGLGLQALCTPGPPAPLAMCPGQATPTPPGFVTCAGEALTPVLCVLPVFRSQGAMC